MSEAVFLGLIALAALAVAYGLWQRTRRRGRSSPHLRIDLLKRD